MVHPNDIKAFFFKVMKNGFASGVVPKNSLEVPGGKLIIYEEGPFKLVDFWIESPYSDQTAGMTTISHNGVPVWYMQYGGRYLPVALETLKGALTAAYESGVFLGGRGVSKFTLGGYTYTNSPIENRFVKFSGSEQVIGVDGAIVGGHWYIGGVMVPKDTVFPPTKS